MAAAAPDVLKKDSSYTYWVRQKTEHAAPDPVPRDWRDAKDLEGTLKVPEASYNDLDDLQLEVNLSSVISVEESDKATYLESLMSYLPLIKKKLQEFEDELRAR